MTINRTHILFHPTRTGAVIAEWTAERWRSEGVDTALVDTTSAPRKADLAKHLLVVVPVLGDERLPGEVEACLRRWAGHCLTHAVCLTGDFRSGQRRSPVAFEADRLLADGGSHALQPPVLVDTPANWETLRSRLEHDFAPPRERGGQRTPVPAGACTGEPATFSLSAGQPAPLQANPTGQNREEPLRRLLDLLPAAPRMRFDRNGRCLALSLLDGAPYPHSLAAGLTVERLAEVLRLAGELPGLRWFGLPFAGLSALPAPLPGGLDGLDLRGNRLGSFDFIADQQDLRAINLAGCDLAHVPSAVGSLRQLHTAVLAKNRLTDPLSHIGDLPILRRLTLYRNQLSLLDGPVNWLRSVQLLNLGANPLQELPARVTTLPALEVLGLRLLPIAQVPEELALLPALRKIDVSKTAAIIPPALSRAHITLLDGMPKWAWDDALDEGERSDRADARTEATQTTEGTVAS